jgi:hypothetical protein
MALEQTYPTKLGNFLKHEYAPETGYCRAVATIPSATVNAERKNGRIIYRTQAGTGNWLALPNTLVAGSEVGVIVDRDDELGVVSGGNIDAAVIIRGPAEIRLGGTTRAGTTTDAVVTAALRAQGIEVAAISSLSTQVVEPS